MKIKTLLRKKSSWIKGTYAKNSLDMHVDACNKFAVCWCLQGAIEKCTDFRVTSRFTKQYQVIEATIKDMFPERVDPNKDVVVSFNDHPETKFSDIRQVLVEANV